MVQHATTHMLGPGCLTGAILNTQAESCSGAKNSFSLRPRPCGLVAHVNMLHVYDSDRRDTFYMFPVSNVVLVNNPEDESYTN